MTALNTPQQEAADHSSARFWRTLALVSILLVASVLRFHRLDNQSFWNDEGNSARAAERSIPLILDAAEGDVHPPGYYLALHYWRELAGESEFALRALSVFCGILTVAFTFKLGNRLQGWTAGLGAALLAALSPLAVYYSQEARMYAPLGLLSAASTYLALAAFSRGGWARSVAYVLVAAAGLYTQYVFGFILLVHNLVFLAWWIGRSLRGTASRRQIIRWALLQTSALLLYLPWLPVLLNAVTARSPTGYPPTEGVSQAVRALTVGITLAPEQGHGAVWSAIVLLLIGLWPRRRGAGPIILLATWLLGPIALIFAVGLYKPEYLKALLIVQPPLHILIANGVENLTALVQTRVGSVHSVRTTAPRLLRLILYALFCAGTCLLPMRNLYYEPAYARDDYRQITADIESMAQPGDGIILNAANQWEVFTYYHRQGAPVYPIPRSRPPRADHVASEMEQIADSHERLFGVYWGDAESDPQRLVESWLSTHAFRANDRWYGRVRVATYGIGPLLESPTVDSDAVFGELVRLLGYDLVSEHYGPGDIIPVTLFWEPAAQIDERYKVFVHLLDVNGGLTAQTDAEPQANLLPTTAWTPGSLVIDQHGVLLPQEISAGEYTLVVGLYSLASGDRLPATVGATPTEDHLVLGSVVIAP